MSVEHLDAVITRLVACGCEALAAAERPVCDCGTVIGNPVLGPEKCCECTEGTSGALIGTLERIFDASNVDLSEVIRIHPCRLGTVAADVSLLLARCYPTINEKGETPDLVDTTVAASELQVDAAILWTALVCCAKDSGFALRMRQVVVESDPLGGCSQVIAQVTVELKQPLEQGS